MEHIEFQEWTIFGRNVRMMPNSAPKMERSRRLFRTSICLGISSCPNSGYSIQLDKTTNSGWKSDDFCSPLSNSISWRSLPPARNESMIWRMRMTSGWRAARQSNRFQHCNQLEGGIDR